MKGEFNKHEMLKFLSTIDPNVDEDLVHLRELAIFLEGTMAANGHVGPLCPNITGDLMMAIKELYERRLIDRRGKPIVVGAN